MASTRIIEEERGTYVGGVHRHNGYYAGDFGRRETLWSTVPNFHPVASTPGVPFTVRRAAR